MNQRAIWDAKDCAFILIDYQAEMFRHVKSNDTKLIEANISSLTKAAKAFNIPVILSTVGVELGANKPTIEALSSIIPEVRPIDRSSMNAWEDEAFVKAVKATGKKRLVICGLYTEICLAFPVVDAIKDGFEVCFVSDAVGGMSLEEHQTAITRMIQAGAIPNTTMAMICEWFRDWKSPLASKGREFYREHLSREHQELVQHSFH